MSVLSLASIWYDSESKRQTNVAGISVRQLDEETVARLRARAATHGVSMEEEARRILKEAVSAPERLGDLALQLFGPRHGVDLQLPEPAPHSPIEFCE